MPALERILVGVDLHPREQTPRPGSLKAVEQARWVARRLGAELHLLHSTHPDDATTETDPAEVVAQGLSAEGRARLEDLLEECRADGLKALLETCPERSWHALTSRVLAGQAQLVVVGKRELPQERDARRLGTVACNLLRQCPGPVWFVKPEHDLSHKLVLAATDLSDVGDACIDWAALVAEGHEGTLHVAHAYRVPGELQSLADTLDPDAWAARLEDLRTQAQARVLAELEGRRLGKDPVLHIGRNTPLNALREAVEHLHPDLLVMGAISTGGRPGYLLGSTAEKMIERVDCSVLVLKPSDFVSPLTSAGDADS